MSKGSDRERQYVELCNRAGMGTYRPATVRYGENDMMGLFDVLAFSPSHSAIHAVQVKSNQARGIKAWSRHTRLFRRLGLRTFYAVPVDREGWRLIEVRDDYGPDSLTPQPKRVDVVDERAMDTVAAHGHTKLSLGDGVVQWLKNEAQS